MTTTSVADGLRPLPIRPRPQAGENPTAYIRRLARANHLRSGYLLRYLREGGPDRQIRLDRLAVLAARPVAALEHAFAQAPPPRRPHPSGQKQRKTDLFAAIRQDAEESGRSVRALADRHGVHRRTVRQALSSPIPMPRKRPIRRSRLDPFKDEIGAILEREIDNPHQPAWTIKQIFDHLVTEHQAMISYSAVRDYVAGRRSLRPRPGRTQPTASNVSRMSSRLSHGTSGAMRRFAGWVARGSVGHPMLDGINYWDELKDSPSQMEICFAIFANVLELDEHGDPINEKYAERRAATYLYRYCTGHLPPGEPDLEPWECDLY